MSVNITWSSLKSWLREVASIVGLIVSIGGFAHLPTDVNTALLAVSGWLQVTQHQIEAAASSATTAAATTTTPGATTTAASATTTTAPANPTPAGA